VPLIQLGLGAAVAQGSSPTSPASSAVGERAGPGGSSAARLRCRATTLIRATGHRRGGPWPPPRCRATPAHPPSGNDRKAALTRSGLPSAFTSSCFQPRENRAGGSNLLLVLLRFARSGKSKAPGPELGLLLSDLGQGPRRRVSWASRSFQKQGLQASRHNRLLFGTFRQQGGP